MRLARSPARFGLSPARGCARFGFLLVMLLGWSCFPCDGYAQESPQSARGPLALHWVRLSNAEPCISGDALARAVEAKLRRSVFPAPRDGSVLIEGSVAKVGDRYQAELRMTSPEGRLIGSRSLSSNDPSCRELSETLTVVLAVMIDPDVAKRTPTATSVSQRSRPPEEAASARQNHLLPFARVLIGITRKPLIGFGGAYERALGVAGGLRAEAVSFMESADEQPASTLPPGATSYVRLSYAGLAYCPLWLVYTRVRLSACAGVELGVVNARDDGFPPPAALKDLSAFWGSASAAGRFAVLLVGRLELHVGASLLGAFGPKLFVNDPQRVQIWILPKDKGRPIGGAFDLGLGARF